MPKSRQEYVPQNHDDLEWLVKCRAENHSNSLALYKVLTDNATFLRLKKNSRFASNGISMVAISFSLWRAVFLTDRTGALEHRFEDAWSFLGTLISDNTITYTQDKNSREWTFNYYINNARYRLEAIANKHPEYLPHFDLVQNAHSPEDLWEYCQKSTALAITNYGLALQAAQKKALTAKS